MQVRELGAQREARASCEVVCQLVQSLHSGPGRNAIGLLERRYWPHGAVPVPADGTCESKMTSISAQELTATQKKRCQTVLMLHMAMNT